MNYPRVLVLANNSFSQSNSNGRTLGTLFRGWPKDRLAQMAVMMLDPDYELCANYYQVRDADAIRALVHGENSVTGHPASEVAPNLPQRVGGAGKRRKTALTMLLRDAVWRAGRWQGKRFRQWVDSFNPEVVLLQCGDSAFMFRMARKLAAARRVPLVLFNTEGYYFFDHNFMAAHPADFIALPIWRGMYRREVRKALKTAAHSIYLNHRLMDDYQSLTPHAASVIFNSSALEFRPKGKPEAHPRIAYLGNLGLRRPEALAEAAEVVRDIWPDGRIDVYGNAKPEARAILEAAPGIRFHGTVPYAAVVKIIYDSDILLHVEKRDPVLMRELRYAFSTKIADSICSGSNFLIYAPSELACSQYAIETGAAWQASTPAELRATLLEIVNNYEKRRNILEKARAIAAINHSAETNSRRFRSILNSIVNVSH